MATIQSAGSSTDYTFLHFGLIVLGLVYGSVINAKNTEFEFLDAGERFQYSVEQTGENYTFKFEKDPGGKSTKIKAGYHVLQSVYQDTSINKNYSESYIRERARCYVFDSRFYTYSLCVLPNDFNHKNKDRFWGFVTQIPNWKWLVTRILLPIAMAFALLWYVPGRKKGA